MVRQGPGTRSRHEADQGRAFMFNGRKMLSRGAVGVAIAGAVARHWLCRQRRPGNREDRPDPADDRRAGVDRKQIDNAIKLYMQQKVDTVAGKRSKSSQGRCRGPRQHQAPRAGTDRQRQGQFHRRIRCYSRGPGGGAAGDQAKVPEIVDGGGHLDHHRAFALHRAHQFHPRSVGPPSSATGPPRTGSRRSRR